MTGDGIDRLVTSHAIGEIGVRGRLSILKYCVIIDAYNWNYGNESEWWW